MNTALLIIDVQRAFFDATPRPYEADAVVSRINELARQARAMGRPVFIFQLERGTVFLEYGSERWHLERNLYVAPSDHLLRKTSPDAFSRTSLHTTLHELGIQQLVICGYASEFCIDETVRTAATLGYKVILAADGHTTHDKELVSAAMIRAHENVILTKIPFTGKQVQVIPSTDITFGADLKS